MDLARKRNLIGFALSAGSGDCWDIESWMLLCKFNCMLVF